MSGNNVYKTRHVIRLLQEQVNQTFLWTIKWPLFDISHLPSVADNEGIESNVQVNHFFARTRPSGNNDLINHLNLPTTYCPTCSSIAQSIFYNNTFSTNIIIKTVKLVGTRCSPLSAHLQRLRNVRVTQHMWSVFINFTTQRSVHGALLKLQKTRNECSHGSFRPFS